MKLMFMKHFVSILWNHWSQPSPFQGGKKVLFWKMEKFQKTTAKSLFFFSEIIWWRSPHLHTCCMWYLLAFFPWACPVSFFWTDWTNWKDKKEAHIYWCIGVSNLLSVIGYIVGSCITFSWQLHIQHHSLVLILMPTPLSFLHIPLFFCLVQLILFIFPEQLVTERRFPYWFED